MADLRDQISTESWAEDLQYAMIVFSRREPQQVSEGHIYDYLANRYLPNVALLEGLAVQASYNWLVRNWEELLDLKLIRPPSEGAGFMPELLVALHNMVFRTVKQRQGPLSERSGG